MSDARRDRGEGAARLDARRAVAVVAAGLAFVLLAFVFAAGPLFVPGVALVAIGAGVVPWVWSSARGARVRRALPAGRIVEEQPFEATIEVRRGPLGRGGWSRFEVIDPLTGSRLRLGGELAPFQDGRTMALRVTTRFARRGQHRLPPPVLLARDPLDLAHVRSVAPEGEQTVLVLPRTEPVRWLGAHRGTRLQAAEGDARAEAMAATDLQGLRPYRPGTPASRIHWPAVARGRGLIERKLQADGDSRPLVVLDGRERQDADPGALDAAVRATASLALELARAGGCGLLLPGEQRPARIDPELLAWPAVYGRLALVGTDPAHRVLRAPSLGGAAGRTGAVIYVSAGPTERLSTALLTAGGGPAVLVVPRSQLVEGRPRGIAGRATPALEVSGCRGFALGSTRHHDRDRHRGEVVA